MTYDAVGSFVCWLELLEVALICGTVAIRASIMVGRSERWFDEIKCGCNYS